MRNPPRLLLWIILLLAVPAVLLFTVWAGQGAPDMVWTSAPGWSMARRVAVSADTAARPQAVPVAVGADGAVYLLTTEAGAGGPRPLVSAIGRDAATIWRRGLDGAAGAPSQPALIWDGQLLRAFWLGGGRLYTASLAPSGEVVAAAQKLAGGAAVRSYAAAAAGPGEVALWYEGPPESPGLYALPAGDLAGPAQTIDPAGTRPAIKVDAAGTLHAVWVAPQPPGQGALWYGSYAGADPGRGRAEPVAGAELPGVGDQLAGPWFGIDDADGYLLWTATVATGMNAGSIYTQYLSFPLGAPAQAQEVRALGVPDRADLSYAPAPGGGLPAGPRVALAADRVAGGAPPNACAAGDPGGELAFVCRALVRYRGNSRVDQAGALFFAAGRPASYQLVSFGAGGVFTPALARDGAGQLYMTWVSLGSAGLDVYLASTAPDLGAALGRPGPRDVGRVGFDVLYGMVSGLIVAPFAALLWTLAPLALLGATAGLRRDRGELRDWTTLLSLGLALGAYWAGKWTLLRDARAYVPFSAWVPDIPGWLGPILWAGVPLATAALALWVAWRRTYRRDSPSALLFTLIYIAVDAPLTMAVYGGVFFGAFYPFA